jgi:hypothetical protein
MLGLGDEHSLQHEKGSNRGIQVQTYCAACPAPLLPILLGPDPTTHQEIPLNLIHRFIEFAAAFFRSA